MREYEIGINEFNRLLLHIDKTFKNDIEKINIYKALVNGLKSYENRVINVRIEKIVQDILKNYYVSYCKRYGWYQLYVSNKCINFEIILAPREQESNKTRFKISYLEDKLKELEEKHKKDILNSKNVSEIVGKFNTALKYFREAERGLYDIPEWFNFNKF